MQKVRKYSWSKQMTTHAPDTSIFNKIVSLLVFLFFVFFINYGRKKMAKINQVLVYLFGSDLNYI